MVKKKKRKYTKREKLLLRDKLDELYSNIIKTFGCCEYCGKTVYLNAHHFYSRSAMSTRWSFNNGFCLCSGHHTLSSKFSAHKTPSEFVEWAINKRGEAWYRALQKRHSIAKHYTIPDLQDLLIELGEKK